MCQDNGRGNHTLLLKKPWALYPTQSWLILPPEGHCPEEPEKLQIFHSPLSQIHNLRGENSCAWMFRARNGLRNQFVSPLTITAPSLKIQKASQQISPMGQSKAFVKCAKGRSLPKGQTLCRTKFTPPRHFPEKPWQHLCVMTKPRYSKFWLLFHAVDGPIHLQGGHVEGRLEMHTCSLPPALTNSASQRHSLFGTFWVSSTFCKILNNLGSRKMTEAQHTRWRSLLMISESHRLVKVQTQHFQYHLQSKSQTFFLPQTTSDQETGKIVALICNGPHTSVANTALRMPAQPDT